MMGACGLLVSVAISVPAKAHTLAVLFPPWWSAPHAFAAAGQAGRVVASGRSSAILIVQSDAPALDARLRAAGALLLFNPLGAGPCASPPSRNPDRDRT